MLTRKLGGSHLLLSEVGDFARLLLIFDGHDGITGVGRAVQSQDFDRDTGARFLNRLAVFIEHGAHTSVLQTGEHNVALLQRTLLNQQRRNSAPAFIESGFDHNARRRHIGRRRQLEHL